MSMRNKAKNAAAKKAIGVGGNDSDSAGERKRLEHLRTKVCAVVLLSFLADRRLEACVRVSWMCCRRLADVSVIPEPLRRAVTAAGAFDACVRGLGACADARDASRPPRALGRRIPRLRFQQPRLARRNQCAPPPPNPLAGFEA